MENMKYPRFGIGFDAHPFTKDRNLILGGVKINYPLGLKGHSDADVLCHAIIDALLGAASLQDIGNYFPDNDPDYRDISSLILLTKTLEFIKNKDLSINNIDATVIAQEPKIAPYLPEMKENISSALNISPEDINIKATTTEFLGFTGRKEGIAALAVASLI